MRRRRLPAVALLLAVLAATALTAVPASAGGGCHGPATDGRGSTLALTELCFSPTVLRVEEGTEVTIVNRDPMAHPLSRPGREWAWDGAIGDRTTVRLDKAGVYPFFCFVHPGMVGVVVVGDGQGTGSGIVQVADTGTAAGAEAAADGTGARGATADSGPGQLPVAWLVLVALAALVGSVVGTRLTTRGRAGAG
jgi:plastocyanin